jgi:hypothetical protein
MGMELNWANLSTVSSSSVTFPVPNPGSDILLHSLPVAGLPEGLQPLCNPAAFLHRISKEGK